MTTTTENVTITVSATIQAPVEKVWELWTAPKHIIHWNNASSDWHTTYAENDLHTGGKFLSRMEAKDGSAAFDFTGDYTKVEQHKQIEYYITDGRKVEITFIQKGNETVVNESFEAEHIHSAELQQGGWQSILDNFKTYVEKYGEVEILHFEVIINASANKVYQCMLDQTKWNHWTAEFNPTSSFEGSWKKGSKMLFIGTEQDGTKAGMVSKIRENIPNKFISIEHIGMIKNGNEVVTGAEVEPWAGALENYSFTEINGQTRLSIDLDSNQQYKSYFMETWPKALNKLKEICEQ